MKNPGGWQYNRLANHFGVARLGLASAVIISHSAELLDGNRRREPLDRLFHTVSLGELAVAFFFLVSGHLVAQSWDSSPNVGRFLAKRVRRVYPGFSVAWLISTLIVGWLGGHAPGYFRQFHGFEVLGSLAKLHAPDVKGAFTGTPFPEVNGSMWTIQTEFRCYLLVPLLGYFAFKRRPWVILVLIAAAMYLAEKAGFVANAGPLLCSLLLGQPGVMANYLVFFISGIGFYVYRNEIRYYPAAAWICGLVAFASLCATRIYPIVLPTLGAYAFFAAVYQAGSSATWEAKLLDISYGIYLYGYPIQKLIQWYWRSVSPWEMVALALPLAAGCAWLSWVGVERRFLQRSRVG